MTPDTIIHVVIALGTVIVTGIGGYFAARISTVRALAQVQTDIEWIKSSRTERDRVIEDMQKRLDRLEAATITRAATLPVV